MTDGHGPNDFEVTSVPELAGITGLASWFHQDWKLMFSDVTTAARFYVQGLSAEEKSLLRAELEEFVSANAGAEPAEIRGAWLALGADSWPTGEDTLSVLRDILDTL